MAKLPPETTSRAWFDYIAGTADGTEHTVMFRYEGSDRSANDVQIRFNAMIQALGVNMLMQGWRIIRMRTSLAGEKFSAPQPLIGALAATLGTAAPAFYGPWRARELTCQGRGIASPRRVDFSLYGINHQIDIPANFRTAVNPASTGPLDKLYAAVIATGSPFVAIDGAPIIWYPYFNWSLNAYWKRRARLGG